MSTPADDLEPKLAIELLAVQLMLDETGDRVGDDADDLNLDDI
ncbi:hypothetical protein ACFQKF_09510 [Halalkalicoccus sp. GCM10025322]